VSVDELSTMPRKIGIVEPESNQKKLIMKRVRPTT